MKTINLPAIPRNWDELKPEQMVNLNRIRYEQGQSKENFLFHAFCLLTEMKVKTSETDEDGNVYYLFSHKTQKDFIPLMAWQVHFFIAENLKFLTEDCTRLVDVFPTIKLKGKTFGSPGYAMAGMTYQQYKKAQEHIGYYQRLTQKIANEVKDMESGKRKPDTERIQSLIAERKRVKGRFMAAVYTPETEVRQRTVDGQLVVCNPPEKAYVFSPRQIDTYGEWFEEMNDSETDAVIQLFSGTMFNYRKMFPLLFAENEGGKTHNMNFIQIESSTMNALQAKLNFNNYQTIYDANAPFILEKLHAIIKEGKALDEQHRKMKSHRNKA